jgi:predicted transcriptional regulator YheO
VKLLPPLWPAAVDANGSQLVVGQHVSQSAGDYVELANGVASGREVKEPTDERLVAMRDKRNHNGEPVFGIIKTVMGFRGVSLCGKEKVSGEWTLVCLAYNLKRLHRMVGSVTNGAGGPKSPSMVRKPSGISLVSDWLGEIVHSISPRSLRLLAEFSAERAPTPTGS